MICEKCNSSSMKELPQGVGDSGYYYEESGLNNIQLAGLKRFQCVDCQNIIVPIPKVINLHFIICCLLILQPQELHPEEVAHIRDFMRLSDDNLAEILKTNVEEISAWAKNSPFKFDSNYSRGQREELDRRLRNYFREQKVDDIAKIKHRSSLLKVVSAVLPQCKFPQSCTRPEVPNTDVRSEVFAASVILQPFSMLGSTAKKIQNDICRNVTIDHNWSEFNGLSNEFNWEDNNLRDAYIDQIETELREDNYWLPLFEYRARLTPQCHDPGQCNTERIKKIPSHLWVEMDSVYF